MRTSQDEFHKVIGFGATRPWYVSEKRLAWRGVYLISNVATFADDRFRANSAAERHKWSGAIQ